MFVIVFYHYFLLIHQIPVLYPNLNTFPLGLITFSVFLLSPLAVSIILLFTSDCVSSFLFLNIFILSECTEFLLPMIGSVAEKWRIFARV